MARQETTGSDDSRMTGREAQRLKVSGYIGSGGRVYTFRGQGFEIGGMRSEYSREELRAFAGELIELLKILDSEVTKA